MSIHFISAAEILQYENYSRLMEYMKKYFQNYRKKNIKIPERNLIYQDSPSAIFASMSALDEDKNLYVQKTASLFARKLNDNLPTIHACVIAFCGKTGKLIAILDGQSVTMLKCAVISALIIESCAIRSARKMLIIGTGKQAEQQYIAATMVRDLEKMVVYGRNGAHVDEFIKKMDSQCKKKCPLQKSRSLEEDIKTSDIISTTTSCSTPISEYSDIKSHVHINCMGAHTPESREIPHSLLNKSCLIVEDRNTAIKEAGIVHVKAVNIPELITESTLNFMGQTTIFSSTGHSLLDLITVSFLLQARQKF